MRRSVRSRGRFCRDHRIYPAADRTVIVVLEDTCGNLIQLVQKGRLLYPGAGCLLPYRWFVRRRV
jgi:hypothetical protein